MAIPEFAALEHYLTKKGAEWYVVGGVVRDYALTGVISDDIDIVLHSKWVNIAATFLHQQFDMHIVPLDENFGIYRAINSSKKHYFDIATMQGHTIEKDLTRRDLSLNAIAVNVSTRKMVDPCNGLLALEGKQIEMIAENNFIEDPLRLLRLYRFSAQLDDYTIAPATQDAITALINSKKVSLRRMAVERIHEELTKLLLGANANKALACCIEQKVLLDPFPGFPQAVWQKLGVLFNAAQKLDKTLWQAILQDPILMLWLGLVAINHVKLSDFTVLSERYKWSQIQRNTILRVMTFLSQNASPEITDDFFDSLGQGALCYWIFAYMSFSSEEGLEADLPKFNAIWQKGLAFWEREAQLPKLLTGSDITKYFKRESGPWVGAALALLRSAQRQNKVHTYKEALEFLRHALSSHHQFKLEE